ncbi:MAG: hypothetical protein CMG75_10650 [Candidatus Marinimicrobia bacterium]|nr:hypothetical protein [Candidatus Neomarinimicrobiota bacterium]
MHIFFTFILSILTSFIFPQDKTVGIVPLDAPEFNRLELFTISDYIRREAEATGNFSEGSTLIADAILGTIIDESWACDEIDCGFDVADRAGVSQVIALDLTRIKKTGTDSTGAITISGNMFLYLLSPEVSSDNDQEKKWLSTVYDRTHQVLTGEPRPADNRVNRWYKGSAENVPEIIKVMTWELLGATPPEGHFSENILSLAQGDFVGKALTFATANVVPLSLGAGGLILVGSGFVAGAALNAGPEQNPTDFGNPPPFPGK